MKGAPRRGDLVAILTLLLAALACVALPLPEPIKAVAAFLLAFAIPGAALVMAIFPRAELPRGTRFTLTVILSISVLALGGLLVQAFVRIDTLLLALLVGVVTIAALVVAERRRGDPGPKRSSALARPSLLALAVLVGAIVLAGVSIGIASEGQHRQFNDEHFTSLFMVPDGRPDAEGEQRIAIGVGNHEGEDLTYELLVRRDGETVLSRRIPLASKQHWESELTVPPTAGIPLIATLMLDGKPYRRAAINVPIDLAIPGER